MEIRSLKDQVIKLLEEKHMEEKVQMMGLIPNGMNMDEISAGGLSGSLQNLQNMVNQGQVGGVNHQN